MPLILHLLPAVVPCITTHDITTTKKTVPQRFSVAVETTRDRQDESNPELAAAV
jgi:hypothetical protein